MSDDQYIAGAVHDLQQLRDGKNCAKPRHIAKEALKAIELLKNRLKQLNDQREPE